MDVPFFKNSGLLANLLGFLALLLSLWGLWEIRKTRRLSKTFFAGKNGGNLENVILSLDQKLKSLEQESFLHSGEIKSLREALGFTVQKIGIVRYSPFGESGGGNYSFSLALLNAHNSGVVITNMYGRQQSRIYTKKLTEGKSEAPLTEEEIRAIDLSNNKIHPIK